MSRLVEQLESMFLTTGDASVEETAGARPFGEGVLIGNVPERRTRGTGPTSLPRRRIVLACAQCGGRNYRKTKARGDGIAPLSLSKFCNICNAHTQHREAV
jgi:large subunit ribosomal protein L33